MNLFQAIDIWMFTGLSFVIASLLVGALVNYVRNSNTKEHSSDNSITRKRFNITKENGKLYHSNINNVSKILFPVVYVIFNIVYWIYYAI